MKKIIVGSVLLAVLGASPAFADKGFSAGASLGYSNISIGDSGINVDFNDVGYKIFGAYMFTDNWGVEGSWLDFGSLSENIAGSNAELDADGFDLYAVGAFPVSDTFDLFGKAGIISWDASASIDGIDQGSDSGEDLALGFGGRFTGASGFGLRAEYEWFDIKDTDSAWMFSVGFEYAFK
ncbi:MAG: porin family protein [Gammaproteobacteria bacterium]|nr:porin family protein [Gammaproteobacteria bacterium]